MHNSVFEFTLEVTTICPVKCAFSRHFVLDPLSSVSRTISPKVNSKALFYSFTKPSTVVASIRPNLYTWSVLSLYRVKLAKYAETRSLILLPRTFKNLTLCVPEHADADSLPIQPKSFKARSIWPGEFSVATLGKFVSLRVTLDSLLRVRLLFHVSDLAQIFDASELHALYLQKSVPEHKLLISF